MLKSSTPHFNARRAPFIIVHGRGTEPDETSQILGGQSEYKVSSHYLIERDGKIVQYVDEENRAWHAGVSYWSGITDLNSVSVGIELQGMPPAIAHETDFHLVHYNNVQMDALAGLIKQISERQRTSAAHILGHQDIDPYRKYDPGPNFDWKLLAEKGVGLWHDLDPVADDPVIGDDALIEQFKRNLALYGYDPRPNVDGKKYSWVVRAFQSHFLPWNITGEVTEQSVQALDILLEKKLSL